jgi:Fur family ferric uptake transcriptional regulator
VSCEQIFRKYLRERGYRLTPQRSAILSVLHDVQGFVTADDIHDRAHRACPAVDVSTVYRTLDLLQKLDLVSSIEGGDGQRRYELLGIHGPHIHLTCQSCGKVIAADTSAATEFAALLLTRYCFHAHVDHLSVPGLCDDCAAIKHHA